MLSLRGRNVKKRTFSREQIQKDTAKLQTSDPHQTSESERYFLNNSFEIAKNVHVRNIVDSEHNNDSADQTSDSYTSKKTSQDAHNQEKR